MLKHCTTLALLCLSTLSLLAESGKLKTAQILTASVKGTVTAIDMDNGLARTLSKGDRFQENTLLITGADSKGVFLFSNGSTLVLKANSQLEVQNYKQTKPEKKNLKLSSLKKEPSTSKTLLNLREGNIVGSTRKLGPDSSYDIKSGAYVSGIRGTRWWMKLNVGENGYAKWGFGIAEGAGATTAPGGAEVVLGEKGVLNVEGQLTADGQIKGATFDPGAMPDKQFNAITGATTGAEEAFDDFDLSLFFE